VQDPRIAALRAEYEAAGLDVAHVHPDPFDQFEVWFGDAIDARLDEPNAMVLATTDGGGHPSARAVLLKGFDRRGFAFYSNFESRKAAEIAENPWVALVFLWLPLHRQVRIEGSIERLAEDESDAYFATRPLGARLGAHVSPQSRVIPDRAWLHERLADLERRFADGSVPRPVHWGGYRVRPARFEFWQGQPDRLHDRLQYREVGGRWLVERLAP
jgi:pyridoxamine 5'-phosphate oxidase